MRFLSITILLSLLLMSCTKDKKNVANRVLETYTHEQLAYPEQPIGLPANAQQNFKKQYYLPWQLQQDNWATALEKLPGKNLSYLKKYLEDDAWYGENKQAHTKQQRAAIVANSNIANFPNLLQKGIITNHTNLRRIPTQKPGFDLYSKAGEGYPFDYFQETNLWANTPVFALHLSKDQQWAYVISPYYKGWVPVKDIAFTDEQFIMEFTKPQHGFPLSDSIVLKQENAFYALKAKMGMLLPFKEDATKPDSIQVYFAKADLAQKAKIIKATLPKTALANTQIPFAKPSLQKLVANLVNKPYGWGGQLENRDCSAMIRDLLATYNVWLPRDSKDQIALGQQFEMPPTTAEKIALIKQKGIPFLTILRKKGHNMLYVGNNTKGAPLVLHAIWGLKTKYTDKDLAQQLKTYPIEGIHEDKKGQLHGRHIIGQSIISSVLLGASEDQSSNALIEDIYTMTNILAQ